MDTELGEKQIAPIPSNKIAGTQLAVMGGTVLPENMKEVESLAQYMAKAGSAIPWSMQGNPGECMAVIMDAIAWRMNPWAVARQRYVTKSKDGNLTGGYMGQLFKAVLNTRAPLKARIIPTYDGEGQNLVCKIRAETTDGQVLEYESPKLKDIKPQNSPLWQAEPKQQLDYYSCRAFGRRHFPELFMGIYDPEEVNEIAKMRDVTPKPNLLEDPEDAPAHVHQGEVIDPPKQEATPREATDIEDAMDQANEQIDQETGEITNLTPPSTRMAPGDDLIDATKPLDQTERAEADYRETVPMKEETVTPERMYMNLVEGVRSCRTVKEYEGWRKDYMTTATRKAIGDKWWKQLGPICAEVEDKIGFL